MYCSSCGAAVAHSLIYCNHCGEKLSAAKGDSGKASEVSPESLVGGIVSAFVLGLGAIIALVAAMKKLDFNEGLINAFLLFSFLLLLVIEGVFIRLLLSSRKRAEATGDIEQLTRQQGTKELYMTPARVLTEPVPSVTEHTTRPLEQIYNDPKSK
jgi:hypothetical protein